MNRIGQFAAGAAIAAMLTTATTAIAQGRPGGPRERPGGAAGFGRLGGPGPGLPLRELNLSDAQQQQVREIEQRHRDAARQLGDRLRTAADAQRQAIETEPVNDNLIRTATQQLAEIEADAAIERAHLRSEILAVLTAEQQAQLKKLEAAREPRAERQAQRLERRQRQQQ